MQIRLNEYKGRLRDAGKRIGNEDIARATGIGISTLNNMSAGYTKEIRLDYIDALATYFSGQLGVSVDQIDLVAPEPITLPLALNIRPDRHGRRVGEKGDGQP